MERWAAPARPILDELCEVQHSRTDKQAGLESVNDELARLQQDKAVLQQGLAALQEREASLKHTFCSDKALVRDAAYWHGQLSDSGRLSSSTALAAAQGHLQAKMPLATAALAFTLFKRVVS